MIIAYQSPFESKQVAAQVSPTVLYGTVPKGRRPILLHSSSGAAPVALYIKCLI
jgi:hypothetical protein